MKYLTTFHNFSTILLTEAFNYEETVSSIQEIEHAFESKLGTLYKIPHEQPFMRNGDTDIRIGIQYFVDNKQSFRLNWSEAWGKSIESIDVFDGSTPYPNVNIDTRGLNIIKIIPQICEIIKNIKADPNITFTKDLIQDGVSLSAISESDAVIPGTPDTNSTATKPEEQNKEKEQQEEERLSGSLNKKTLERLQRGKLPMFPGKNEKNMDLEISRGEKKIKNIKIADPSTIFNDIDELCELVIDGVTPALLISGGFGNEKIKKVVESLEKKDLKKDTDFVIIKGNTSAFGLYVTLFQNKNKIIIFNESDSIFKDEKSSDILTAALESDDNRYIKWKSKDSDEKNKKEKDSEEFHGNDVSDDDIPGSFEFTGSIIFITNSSPKKVNDSIKSRSFIVDLATRSKDTVRIIESALKDLVPEYSYENKITVVEYLKDNIEANKYDSITMKTVIKAIRIHESKKPNWKKLVDCYAY